MYSGSVKLPWLLVLTLVPAAAGAQVPPPPEGAPTTPALERLLAQHQVQSIADGFTFADGAFWHRLGFLLFADGPRSRIHRWDPRSGLNVFREPSDNAIAFGLDPEGRLLSAEQAQRRISRTEADATTVTLVDRFEGKRLNSPNDLIVATDGAVFFTDPPYGLPNQTQGKELDFQGVFRLAPDGRLTVVSRDMPRPNGIGLSPDGRTLYVSDSERRELRSFTLTSDGSASGSKQVAQITPWKSSVRGVPDGLALDADGHVYVAGPGGVWVFAANGGRLGVIPVPETPSSCAFGDPDGKTLYITARTRLYKIRMTVAGLPRSVKAPPRAPRSDPSRSQ
jgi:gluconolactonase